MFHWVDCRGDACVAPTCAGRKSPRLKGYDYAQPGAYFVTICTKNRVGLFGDLAGGAMRLNHCGEIAIECWKQIPAHFPTVQLDDFIVMPDHVHGILVLTELVATEASPAATSSPSPRPSGLRKSSLGAVVGSFKSAVSKRINRIYGQVGTSIWQRNYYEHVVRNNDELTRIREYIWNNSLRP